ncbi:MAG: hypothetical protein GF344_09240, partial [Chitinivibrionales bacterium]|nr:hypothetical protein [Chitinivibrionales bacterium]MBD3357035.1 hypothetical protein [Chitinivibrionales bacterium]
MNNQVDSSIHDLCAAYGNDAGRLMDILIAVQRRWGRVEHHAIDLIAERLRIPRVEVEST